MIQLWHANMFFFVFFVLHRTTSRQLKNMATISSPLYRGIFAPVITVPTVLPHHTLCVVTRPAELAENFAHSHGTDRSITAFPITVAFSALSRP